MTPIVYDTGVLVAADKNDRQVWADHRIRLEAGIAPLVPSPVVAQASRSPRQAQLRRFLRGCEVTSFDEADGHRAGELLGKAKTEDVVDASVVCLAIRREADIATSDPEDIARLVTAAGSRLVVIKV